MIVWLVVGPRRCSTRTRAAQGAVQTPEIDEAEVIYWGRCPTCRQAAEGA